MPVDRPSDEASSASRRSHGTGLACQSLVQDLHLGCGSSVGRRSRARSDTLSGVPILHLTLLRGSWPESLRSGIDLGAEVLVGLEMLSRNHRLGTESWLESWLPADRLRCCRFTYSELLSGQVQA